MIDNFFDEYHFLSNFSNSEIVYEGIKYPTVEHAFQAAKTFDCSERHRIANLATPGLAKKAGRNVNLREDWEMVKDDIMYQCLKLKFSIPHLRDKLIATGDEELVEGTKWHDNYWGNCTCEKCKSIVGKNELGKTLMKIREEIKHEK